MTAYLVRRLLQSVLVLFGIVTIVFFLMRLTGDAAVIMTSPDASTEEIEIYRKAMGLDRPLHVQYVTFIAHAVRGDFGKSLRFREPALGLVVERLPKSLQLALAALAFGLAIGIPVGLFAALRRNTVPDSVFRFVALLGQSMPTFWLGIVLILIFAVRLDLLPSSGHGDWRHLIMPAVTLGSHRVALFIRLSRSSLLEVLGEDYVRTARAKGLPEYQVLSRHAVRNALIPLVTVIGLQLPFLLSGAIITESIFAWPGIGRLAITSISWRDYPVVLATVFVSGVIFVAGNLVADICYSYIDPRIKYEG